MSSEARWVVEPSCQMEIKSMNESFDGEAVTSDMDKLSLTFLESP